MDEIIIEEKKYVSSKQAAKMTGYAKDYVGQLCREGRVPARLVGRSWYVLESAIQDHRFGTQEPESKETIQAAAHELSSIPDTWESPRYEAIQMESLPTLTRSREEEPNEGGQEVDATRGIHEAWRDWFDQVATSSPEIDIHKPIVVDSDPVQESETNVVNDTDSSVGVPLHVVEQPLPSRDFFPRKAAAPMQKQPVRRQGSKMLLKVTAAALISSVAVVIAVIGSGYLDGYLISHEQLSVFSGIWVYNK